MSRQTDQVIDDDESETCPLCIEEFDLSDYNFYPCPCGYQICQFCYNNIKTTMNGLCPACRRQYDDKNIRWKQITPEEIKSHQENVAQQAKRKAALRQKEAAKREADSISRKHLAGIRVRQKNLVYITGMKPTSSTDALSEILRRDDYFGQYGKIIKVVVSKTKDTTNPHAPVGVYVTFETKDAAGKCIQAVDGSQNYDTRLRAQYGTTKYCSAYLRGDTCSNKGCMFLHEPGDVNESFSRQDLSSMNVISTQSPAQANMQFAGQPPQPQPPPQQAPQSIAAASWATDRRDSRSDSTSQADSADSSGLPTSSTWANKPAPSRQTSQHIASPSPLASTPVLPSRDTSKDHQEVAKVEKESSQAIALQETEKDQPRRRSQRRAPKPRKAPSLINVVRRALASEDYKFVFDDESIDEEDRRLMKVLPPLFDPQGAARRRLARKHEIEQTLRENDTHVATQALSAISTLEQDENTGAGSLQLGGEPEEVMDLRGCQAAIRPPSLDNMSSPIFGMEHTMSPTAPTSATPQVPRGVTSQQQQHLLLQHLKSSSPESMNQNYGNAQMGPQAGGPSHARQASRYSFANDSTASASVKSVANPSLMSQQNSMMPSGAHTNQYISSSQHQSGSQYFSSGVQGPPPGLKATGTPPVSGGGMFGQGHGFATAGLNYGINPSDRNTNSDKMRDLLRNRQGSMGSGQTSDAGRFDLADSTNLPTRAHQGVTSGHGIHGAQGQGGFNSMPFSNSGYGGRW